MRIDRLGHVNIRTPDFAGTIRFYERALGLRAGPGASATVRRENVWLHDAAGAPLIHVNGLEPGETAAPPGAAGRLDHFALECSGLESGMARLREAGVPFELLRIPSRDMVQLNIHDPNGLKVELTFHDPAAARASDQPSSGQ